MLTILDSFADRKIATPRHLIRQPVWFIAHSTRRNLRYSVEHFFLNNNLNFMKMSQKNSGNFDFFLVKKRENDFCRAVFPRSLRNARSVGRVMYKKINILVLLVDKLERR